MLGLQHLCFIGRSYPVEKNGYRAVRVNVGLVASEVSNLANDADMLTDRTVKVGRSDARSRKLFRHCGSCWGFREGI